MSELEQAVKRLGKELGFDLVRITSLQPFFRDEDAALQRIRQGLMDGMPWFSEERVRKAAHPEILMPDARSIIVLAMSYYTREDEEDALPGSRGRIARYAWGDDYHKVMKERLHLFVGRLSETLDHPVKARIFVDDGPMLERAVAERAGLGWFGKNTMILTPTHGSWIFLGEVITDLVLEPDKPLLKNCGQCTQCIDKCPTGAIIAPYVIDAPRCISYLTIEHRGPIPRHLRPLVGDWVFGCDICQEVCPVNRRAEKGHEKAFTKRSGFGVLDLISILGMSDEDFRDRFHNSPIKRAKRVGLQRNACVALGNIGNPIAVPALTDALKEGDSLVRGHAAWALGRIATWEALLALELALAREEDQEVREELVFALETTAASARSG
ncbi:MAG: tRNA epoxyqueuosine(34) reductase QueG [Chloroflexi bacterium]|nr:tRNA epoxyqueuosine(34) reductase QueG [Chloroflexota bacterium]